jgi:hypothetical protein
MKERIRVCVIGRVVMLAHRHEACLAFVTLR